MSGLATTFATGRRRKPGSVGKPSSQHRDPHLEPRRAGSGRGAVPRPVGHPRLLERPGRHGRRRSTPRAGCRPATSATSHEDGDLFLVDRKKEMIIRGGYNVYPREVEEVLYEHPAVLEAAVVGVPHETLGEDVAAIVVPRPACRARSRRGEGMGEGARRRIQVPSLRRVGRRVTEEPDRQDPQARASTSARFSRRALGRQRPLRRCPRRVRIELNGSVDADWALPDDVTRCSDEPSRSRRGGVARAPSRGCRTRSPACTRECSQASRSVWRRTVSRRSSSRRLSVLSRHGAPLSTSQLARRAFMTPQSMSEVIHALERKGLIKRNPHPNHRRTLPATLTAKGRRVLAACDAAVARVRRRDARGVLGGRPRRRSSTWSRRRCAISAAAFPSD